MANEANYKSVLIKRQRGEINLLGLGLTLLVVGLLSLYVYDDYSDSTQETKVQAEVQAWNKVFGKTAQYYSTSLDFSGATTATMINNGIFPAAMVNGSSVRNRFQGAVTTQPTTLVDSNDAVQFASANYNADGCRGVAAKLAGGLRKVDVNGTVVKADGGSLDLDSLGTACTAGGSNNTLNFYLGK